MGRICERRLHQCQLERTHLEGFEEAFDKEESFQSVDGRQEDDDGFLRAAFGFLAAESDVQVQVCPESELNNI